MTQTALVQKLKLGEAVTQEFKRGRNGINADVCETVRSFLNCFDGDIFLGIDDDGKIEGVPENAVRDLTRNGMNCLNNPSLFSLGCAAAMGPVAVENKTALCVYVPNASQVHAFKGNVYDRQGDSDIVVVSTDRIAE